MRILLTGAAGYVGSRLWQHLLEAGHSVTPIDLQWFRKIEAPAIDVRSITDIGDADAVIHLAAIANDPSVDFYPRRSWETGCLATMRLAEAAAKKGARFIYASSVSVYGADRGMVTEDMDLRPLSDYNKTKMAAERVLLSYADRLPIQIIRPATICGLSPRMRLDLSVNTMTIQALTKSKMTVFGGKQWRPSIHIEDMCALYLFMLDHPEHTGIWNAGFENNTLLQIAERVAAITGATIEVTPEVDKRSYQVNSDKLLATGFKPQYTINSAIVDMVNAWRLNLLRDEPQAYNLGWMKHLALEDK